MLSLYSLTCTLKIPAQKAQKKAAVTDPMTGLLNKASSQEEIDLLAKSNAGALMMIDLDSFKNVDRYAPALLRGRIY